MYRAPSDRGAVQYDGTIADHLYWTCFNGDSNDVIDGAPPFMFRNDPRIPFMYENDAGAGRLFDPPPETFIIGTAAQGIVKSIKYLTGDPSLIATVEINPAIVSLMENELYSESGETYRGIDPEIIDARTWLMHNDRQFDLITMMNTYTAKNIGYFGEPDFIHTKEAFQAYLDHLSDRGCILIEERDVSDTARAAIFRLINTIMAALEERGSADPSQHLFVYNTNVTKAKLRRNWYTFMVITREPMSERERVYFADWIESRHYIEYVHKQEYSPEMDFTYVYHSQLEYLPGIDTDSEYQAFITSPERSSIMDHRYRFNPTTDDSPYIFDVNMKLSELNVLLLRLGITCAVVLAFAVLMLLKDSSPSPSPSRPQSWVTSSFWE